MPAQRRRPRVTTADFDADPVYDLLRLGDPEDGLWELTEHGRRIGTLRRAATNARAARWEAWSAQPWARIDNRSYPTRAQAALALLLEHRNRAAHTRPPEPAAAPPRVVDSRHRANA